MQGIIAIAWLTWKAALRFRLFLVVALLLLGSVVGLPLLLKDDGTARGFTQILLTYTLSCITALLGLSTLWLACGTLARDIEECQIQMIAVKPIARWQIWLGKWIGLVSLNAALLAISGGSVYALLLWRSTHLPVAQQAILRNEVLVARGSVRPHIPEEDIEKETDKQLKERATKTPLTLAEAKEVRYQIREQIRAEYQIVPPGYPRFWQVDLGMAKNYLRDQPLYLRIKFNTANNNNSGTYPGEWRVGIPNKTKIWASELMTLAPDTFHEFSIPADLFDENGILTIGYRNLSDTALLFPLNEGIEVLYRQGSFALNYARGLGIILCWMGLLAALGLAAASLLSFNVSAFFSLGVLILVLSSGTLATVVSDGTLMGFNSEKGTYGYSIIDRVAVPIFHAVLTTIKLAKDFSPIDQLSTGRSIPWEELSRAFLQIIVFLAGPLGVFGIFVFSRRELATAQGTQ